MQTVISKTLINYLPQLNRISIFFKSTTKLEAKSTEITTPTGEIVANPDEALRKIAMNAWMNHLSQFDDMNDIQ